MARTTWGVYNLQGKLSDGTHVSADDRRATRWFIRWRVNDREHKRTLKQKGHAKTFRKRLVLAQLMGYEADHNGYPIDPTEPVYVASSTETSTATVRATAAPVAVLDTPQTPRPTTFGPSVDAQPPLPRVSLSFEQYCHDVWWPTLEPTLGDRNRAGHRKNMNDAIAWLRYRAGDPRTDSAPRTGVGDSLLLAHVDSDDLKYALACRRSHNDRTAAVNRRRIEKAIANDVTIDIDLAPEIATDRTVRAFWVTLGMVIRSAAASRKADLGSLAGAASMVPRAKPQPVSQRMVPSVQEVFDLSDAIARLGSRMKDGRRSGERFRALVLVAGTLGPRPGELVAHRPDWIREEDGVTLFRFHRSEGRFYDRDAGVAGRSVNYLKHRGEDDERFVPALSDVTEALTTHLERGYALPDRTFASASGAAHLDWSNMSDTHWQPACRRVFEGSSKPELAFMSPKTLRKAAITFWLDSGVSSTQAAEWAGHSEDVAQRYYAGRVSPGFAREAALLAAHRTSARIT